MPTLISTQIIRYVEIDAVYWAMTVDGEWLVVSPDQLQAGIPIYSVASEQIQPDENGEFFINVDGNKAIVPDSISSYLLTDGDVVEEKVSSGTNGADSASEQQGLNLVFQVIQDQQHSIIAKSGFTTFGDAPSSDDDDEFNSATQDSFVPITLTVEFIDFDGYINKQEAPSVTLIGQAIGAPDGQVLELTITDSEGQQQEFEVIAQDEQWQLLDVDFQSFAEGELTATITASTYPGEVNDGLDTSIKDTLATITIEIIDNDEVINLLEQQAVTVRGMVMNVEDGQTVNILLEDGTGNSRGYSTTVSGGTWQLTDLDLTGFEDGSLMATADVIDIAGNSATATDTMAVDILAAITIVVDTGTDAVINASEMPMLDMSGTVSDIEDGQLVTIVITDINGDILTFTTNVVDGAWRIDDADVSSLSDGDLTFVASTNDVAGNAVDTSMVVNKDSLANITVEIVDNDEVINALEQQAVTVRGSVTNVEDGQTVNVVLTDGSGNSRNYSAVVAGSAWQLTAVDLTGFEDGSLTANVDVTDVAGNIATASDGIAVDILAEITIEIDGGNDTVLNSREITQVDLFGTVADIEDGQTVTITVTDVDGQQMVLTTTVIDGTWGISEQDFSSLADGPLTFEASATDIAGNTVTDSDQVYKETVGTITIEAIDNDGVLNLNEIATTRLVGQVSSIEDASPVAITVTDVDGNNLSFSSVVLNGIWRLDAVDLSSLTEGELQLSAYTIDFEGNTASGTNTVIKDTLAAITVEIVDNDEVINSIEQQAVTVQGSVTNVEDGQTVNILLSDNAGNSRSYTAVVAGGAWQLSSVDLSGFEDGSLTADVDVTDLAGNSASATDTIAVDILATITIVVDTGTDEVINAAEMTMVDMSGVVTDIEDGQTVIITVTDINNSSLQFNTTVVGGTWQIDAADLSSLSDGDLNFTASSSDVAGNPVNATVVVNKDSLASITVEIVDNDEVINALEQQAVTVRGTVTNIEDGQTVNIVLEDGVSNSQNYTAVVIGGTWQLTDLDLTGFEDGSLTATVDVTDIAGNNATATDTIAVDILAEITITVETGDDTVLNSSEIVVVDLSGTVTDIEDGQIVTVVVTDINGDQIALDTTVVGGTWTLTDQDLSTLADGDLVFDVTATDIAGNTVTNSQTVVKETLAVITIEAVDNDGVLNQNEVLATTLTGEVTSVEDGSVVAIMVTDINGNSLTFSSVVAGGVWEVTGEDLSSLAEGELTLVAETTDVNGNFASGTNTVIKETLASITVEIVDNDDVINAVEQQAVTVQGTVSSVEDGQTVNIVLTDGINSRSYTTVISGSAWILSDVDLSGFEDGSLTATVDVVDVAGNSATATDSIDVDILAAITIDVETGTDEVINAAEMGMVNILGTVTDIEDGQTVTVTVTDPDGVFLVFSSSVVSGTWQIDAADLSSLSDGDLTFVVTSSDVAGNPVGASIVVNKDSLASITIEVIDDNGLINATEATATTIQGTVDNIEDGQTVTLTITDINSTSQSFNTLVVGGLWQLIGVDLSGFADGELSFQADVADIAGNPATTSTNAILDTQASIDIDTGADGFDAALFIYGLEDVLTGTTIGVEEGQTVELTLTDGITTKTFTTLVLADSTWLFSGLDVTGLDRTLGWDMNVTVTDIAGNIATDEMPTLYVPAIINLYETLLNISDSTSVTIPIEINNADLTIAVDQSRLLKMTSDGQTLSIVVAADGLSFQLTRSDNAVVMEGSLAGNEMTVTMYQPFDELNGENVLTYILLNGLQTDSDDTTEEILIYAVLNIADSREFAFNDNEEVVEDTTATGSLLGNDYTIEGPLIVTGIVYQGAAVAEPTAGAPWVINTDQGTINIFSNGSWTFIAADNLDHNQLQQVSFDYVITDSDGSIDSATATFTVIDGAPGTMVDVLVSSPEPDIDQPAVVTEQLFTITAGSDSLLPDTVAFSALTPYISRNQALTSNGIALSYSVSADGKTLTATTNEATPVTVFTIQLSVVNNGDDLDVTAVFTQYVQLDHLSKDVLGIATNIVAEDLDGTLIEQGKLSWEIADGNNPELLNIVQLAFDEDLLVGLPLTQTGTFDVQVGSDAVVAVTFSPVSSQPDITSGGVVLQYSLSSDGLTLTAHLGDESDPVFVITLSETWSADSDSTGQNYDFTLYKTLDQIDSEDFSFNIQVADFDGDISPAILTVTIQDGEAATIDNVALIVSEAPAVLSYPQTTIGYFNVAATGDVIVDVAFNVVDGAEVTNSSGTVLTQNGATLYWEVKDNGAIVEAVTASGDNVFSLTLPTDVEISPDTASEIEVVVKLLGPIDHLGAADLSDLVNVGVDIRDSDNTVSSGVLGITIFDGALAKILTPITLNVDEGNLISASSVSDIGQLIVVAGSDVITEVSFIDGFADSFNSSTYSSGGQAITLSATPDSSGWYVATRADDSEKVFQIRFDTNGQVEFQQFQPIDHADGDGANTLDLQFSVNAIDADGDKSAAQTITVTITDDLPESTAKTLAFFESDGDTYSVQMFSTSQQGADGATVTEVIYKGVSYAVGSIIELYTDANPDVVKYGELVVDANGNVTVTTQQFAYSADRYTEDILLTVVDADGDSVTDTLTIIAKDEEGSIRVLPTAFVEDTEGTFTFYASPGDVDVGELITSVVFDSTALQGGILLLDGVEVPVDTDGNYIFSFLTGTLTEDSITRVATPNGNLTFTPASDSSDATTSVEFIVTVNIVGKTPLSTTVPVTVESVADTPTWDSDSEFSYLVDEDGGSIDLQLSASSTDQIGIDDQGSETITYVINNIQDGLTLSTSGTNVTNGMTLSQAQLDGLTAVVGENLAGEFTFTIQAQTTESDNGDTALSTLETVTIDVTPIADKPTLVVQNIHSIEDEPIYLSDVISGELTDDSGSETLGFELILPDGWAVNAPSASNSGNVWTVSAEDVESGVAQLIPADDVSSANFGDFSIVVRSFAFDSTQDAIDPADDTSNPNPNYSDVGNITISLTGVANDSPIIDGDPDVWTIDQATGVIANVTPFDEDQLIPLDFTIVTSDDDGSEILDLRISGLPEGVIFVDSTGTEVNLPVVGFNGDEPLFGVSAATLSTLSIQSVEDFSGRVTFTVFVQSTELDGDTAAYELTVNIDIAPVIDTVAATLETTSNGFENRSIPIDFSPILDADIDGSETITGLIIPYQTGGGFILTLDGSAVDISTDGLDLSTLIDTESPTLNELLSSGRIAVVPPRDADGTFTFPVSYLVRDTSETGAWVESYVQTELIIVVDAVVNNATRLESEEVTLVSSDGSAIDLTGQVLFFEGDIDGSEVLDYIVITVPSGDGWYVYHPNGAIPDGQGRWYIPVDGMTTDTVQEYSLDVLSGVTIMSEVATGPVLINVEGRVLDRDDPKIIETSFYVQFDQDATTSFATAVDDLQLTTADAVEDMTIDFSGHLNQAITTDANDIVSFRVLAADLPQGGYFTGSDVQAIYDDSGENVIEYVFTTDSLSNLQLHNINEHFAGEFSIPIRIIATDPISGDTIIDDTQVIDVEVTPVVDGVTLELPRDSMLEDNPVPLGLTLVFDDPHTSPTTGGAEQILFGDTSAPITLTLLDGGSLSDSSGLWVLQSGSTDTWEFTGGSMALLNASLYLLEFVPPLHLSGEFNFLFSATNIDTATINGVDVTDKAAFESRFTLEVTPVTDAAALPNEQIIATGEEDSLISLATVDLSGFGLIDQDGSEEIYVTIQGVPSGAIIYYQDGDNLVQLPNVGADGGSFQGSPTYAWSVTPVQLSGLVLLPPADFSGDIPLSIQAITQELGTDDFVTTGADIIVGVSPVADGVELITEPADLYLSEEDEPITIDVRAALNEVDGSELISMKVIVSSDDASALVDLEGVKIGSQFISFKYDATNDYYYATLTSLSSLTQFELHPGELAFGTLNVQLEILSVDAAVVLGEAESDASVPEILNFEIEISPQVDKPIWTQVDDVTANDINNVALNLGVELQNPAADETGLLTIYGVPDGLTLSEGSQNGGAWVVDIDRAAFINVIGATDGQVFTLTLEPTATLNGQTAKGAVETITVTVDLAATLAADLSAAVVDSLNQDPVYFSSSVDADLAYSGLSNDLLSRLDDDMALLSLQP